MSNPSVLNIVNPRQLIFTRQTSDGILPLADLIVVGSATANINGSYVVGSVGSATYSGPNSYKVVFAGGVWKLETGAGAVQFKTTGASILTAWVVGDDNVNPNDIVPHFAYDYITFREAWVSGLKTLAGVANTSDVYLGLSGAASKQPFVIGAGEDIRLKAPFDTGWELHKWYLKVATNSDGVVIILS